MAAASNTSPSSAANLDAMRPDIKRIALLLILGAATLAAGIIVLARNRSLDTDLLASVAILGGLAMILVALPLARNGGNGQPE
jgi:hypothetical protein